MSTRMINGEVYCDETDYDKWRMITRGYACVPYGIQVGQFAPYDPAPGLPHIPHPPHRATRTLKEIIEWHETHPA